MLTTLTNRTSALEIGGAIGIVAIVSIYAANVKHFEFSSGLGVADITAAIISLLAAVVAVFYKPDRPIVAAETLAACNLH